MARLGATWSAWFFPTFPSLHCVMNGFLLVCGRGPGLKSILTKAQNTHPSQPASLCPGLRNTPHYQSTCCKLAQSHTVTSATMRRMIWSSMGNILLGNSLTFPVTVRHCAVTAGVYVPACLHHRGQKSSDGKDGCLEGGGVACLLSGEMIVTNSL